MKRLFTALFLLFVASCFGQYTTPGNGNLYTLEDLVDLSGGVVVGSSDEYELNASLTIAVTDTLSVVSANLAIAEDVLITVAGVLFTNDALFTQLDCCDNYYTGFRFEESASGSLEFTTIEYGGGMQVLTPNFTMTDCVVRNNIGGQSDFSAISFSAGAPIVSNTSFFDNEFSAISTPANGAVAPQILNCNIQNNVTANVNRPQLNFGPSGADTTRVIDCLLMGAAESTDAGNISMALLAGGEGHIEIRDCEIIGARYGANIYGGNLHSKITGCTLADNNIQNEPMLGGSGISITGFGDNNQHEIRNNVFQNNLWGITLIGNAKANLGEIEGIGPGENVFGGNGNNDEIYALYNNTANEVLAEGNCWIEDNPDASPEEVEEVIAHAVDDSELGEVFFLPLGDCDGVSSTDDLEFSDIATAYPNPSNGVVTIDFKGQVNALAVYDSKGQIAYRVSSTANESRLEIDLQNLPAGIYLLHIDTPKGAVAEKLIIH